MCRNSLLRRMNGDGQITSTTVFPVFLLPASCFLPFPPPVGLFRVHVAVVLCTAKRTQSHTSPLTTTIIAHASPQHVAPREASSLFFSRGSSSAFFPPLVCRRTKRSDGTDADAYADAEAENQTPVVRCVQHSFRQTADDR